MTIQDGQDNLRGMRGKYRFEGFLRDSVQFEWLKTRETEGFEGR
jgi:hypothetical protein